MLCCVRQLCTVIRTHISYMSVGLGLVFVHLGLGFCVFWFRLDCFYLVLFAFVVLALVLIVSSVQHQEIGWEECP